MNSKVFIDTNVLMDVLLGNRPSSEASGIIFRAIKEGRMEGVITTQSLVDAAYCLEKQGLHFQDSFLKLFNFLNVEALDSFDLRHACIRGHGDFEDDAQYAKAEEAGCDFIVTNDRKFRHRYETVEEGIRFYTPEEMVREMVEDSCVDVVPQMERVNHLVPERKGLELRNPTAEELANDPKLAYLWEKYVERKDPD